MSNEKLNLAIERSHRLQFVEDIDYHEAAAFAAEIYGIEGDDLELLTTSPSENCNCAYCKSKFDSEEIG